MPEHYAMDVNVLTGTVHIENAKTIDVDFVNSLGQPVSFDKAPSIQVTLLSAGAPNPYKTKNVKTGSMFTGFTIGFQNNVTVDIEWQAMMRM